MSAHTPEGGPEGHRPLLTRHDFVVAAGRAVVGTAALGVAAGGFFGAREGYRTYAEWRGREDAEKIFNEIMSSSHKLMIYDGLLQVDNWATVSSSMFGHADHRKDWEDAGFIVAQRPIAVHGTLLRNIADHSKDVQNKVDRVLPAISPRLMAFYDPMEAGKLVYLDADANSGLVVPLSPSASSTETFEHLPVSSVNISGRELRGKEIFPYMQDTGERYYIGAATNVETSADLNNVANYYFWQGDPVTIPKP